MKKFLDKLVQSIRQYEKDINELKVLLEITIIPIAHSIRDIMDDTSNYKSRSNMKKLRKILEELKKEADILERNLAIKEDNELKKLEMESSLNQELSYINQQDPSLAQSIGGFMSWVGDSPDGKKELTGSGSVNKRSPETDRKVDSIRLTQSLLKDILKEENKHKEKTRFPDNVNRSSSNASMGANVVQFADEVSVMTDEKEENDDVVALPSGKEYYESSKTPKQAIHSNHLDNALHNQVTTSASNHPIANNTVPNDNLNRNNSVPNDNSNNVSWHDQMVNNAPKYPVTNSAIANDNLNRNNSVPNDNSNNVSWHDQMVNNAPKYPVTNSAIANDNLNHAKNYITQKQLEANAETQQEDLHNPSGSTQNLNYTKDSRNDNNRDFKQTKNIGYEHGKRANEYLASENNDTSTSVKVKNNRKGPPGQVEFFYKNEQRGNTIWDKLKNKDIIAPSSGHSQVGEQRSSQLQIPRTVPIVGSPYRNNSIREDPISRQVPNGRIETDIESLLENPEEPMELKDYNKKDYDAPSISLARTPIPMNVRTQQEYSALAPGYENLDSLTQNNYSPLIVSDLNVSSQHNNRNNHSASEYTSNVLKSSSLENKNPLSNYGNNKNAQKGYFKATSSHENHTKKFLQDQREAEARAKKKEKQKWVGKV